MIEKHLSECEESQKVIGFLEKNKDDKLNYDDENSLKEKGYSSEAIRQIKNWGLIDKVDLPDLNKKGEKGSVKVLDIIGKEGSKNKACRVNDLVIFLVPRSTSITQQNFPKLLKGEKRSDFFYTIHGSREVFTYERIIIASFIWKILEKEGSWNYNVFILETDENNLVSKFSPIEGNSAATAWYLGLLSCYYQKPISQKISTTAALDIGKYANFRCNECFQENELAKNLKENFLINRIRRVGGLEYKIPAAVEAGIKKIILSREQKEDYEKNVPQKIREKLTVYYVKDVEELEELFWRGEFS